MRTSLWMAASVALVAGAAGGDEIVLTSGIPISDAIIRDVRSGVITFRIIGGSTVTKSLADIKQIKLTRAPSFNKAEAAMASKPPDPAAAVAAYDAASTEGGQEWFKALLTFRRLRALVQAGMVDRAVEDWLAIMDREGASAAAVRLRPKRPAPKGSPRNKKAVRLLEKRLSAVRGKKDYVEALRRMLMLLYRTEGLTKKADELAKALAGEPAKPGSPTSTGPAAIVPAAGGELGKQLEAARTLVRRGQTPANLRTALKRVEANLKRFDEAQLGEALLVAGKARAYLAEGLSGDEKRKMLLDAGLDLMRVVAHFPGTPEAMEALFEAGGVNARLGNVQAAKHAYREVINRAGDKAPLTARARKALDSLDGK